MVKVLQALGEFFRLDGPVTTRGTKSSQGFSDLLAYSAAVGDGVWALKDAQGAPCGPLMGGFWYDGVDIESQSWDELHRLRAQLNMAFRKLDAGWMVHFQAYRRTEHGYLPGGCGVPVDQLIDEERARAAHYYVNEFAIFVTRAQTTGQSPGAQRVQRFLLGQAAEAILEDGEERLLAFEQTLSELERSLAAVFPGVRRMRTGHDHDELYAAVNYALNGVLKRCRPSAYPVHLDTSLARQLEWSAGHCVYDEDAIAVVGLVNLPLKSTPAVLANLGVLGIEYRFATRFIPFDYLEARARMRHIAKRWNQAGSLVQQDEVAEAQQDLEQGHVRYGHYSAVVILRERIENVDDASARRRAHDVVNERARVVAKALQESGFEAIIERSNKLEAFLASLPGHGVEHVRKPLVNTVNVADMVPLAREWNGSAVSPCTFYPPNSPALLQARTWSGAPFYFNLHQGDVGHAAIFGPTGKGKSTLLGLICSQFSRYANSQVFVVDFGYSMYALTAAQPDGVHYALGGGEEPELCPLAQLETHDERAWAADWIASLCEEQRVELTPELRQVIFQAVEELAASTVEAAHRTLADYRVHLQHPRLNAVLDYYISGPGGRVLNGSNDALRYARFSTFETERLFGFGAAVATPTLSYVFRQIERRLDGRPTLLVIDEAWLALRRYGDKLREWLKTLRKKNCAVILATQSLSDVVNSPLADVVFESCPTKVLLPNEQATAQEELYVKRLMLNAAQVETLSRVEGKRWYMQLVQGRSRMFSLDLGPVALAFVGAGGKADLARIQELEARWGKRWAAEWLAERGLVDAALRLRELEARARGTRGGL